MISFGKTSHCVALAALLAAATIGAAHAITDSAFKYSTPRTGYYSIDSTALAPETETVGYNSSFDFISPSQNDSPACFFTGVNLPHGATVTAFTVWFRSAATDAGEPSFGFRRKKFSDGGNLLIASRSFAENSGTRRQGNVPVDADTALINNAQYSYQVQICLRGNGDAFYHGKLTYTYNNAGD